MLLPRPALVTHSRALRRRTLALGALTCVAGALGCGRSHAADAGGDTALARDLAIVQMETNRQRDSAVEALARAASTPAPAPVDSALDSTTLPPPLPADTPTTASQIASAAALPAASDTPVHAVHKPVDPCDSPARASQLTCLRRRLAEYDAPLNRVYQRYLARLRAAPANRGGGAPAIRKLRESQRAWLVYRDQMCQHRLAANEPKLWAPGRAACLGEYATARTKLLTDMLDGKR